MLPDSDPWGFVLCVPLCLLEAVCADPTWTLAGRDAGQVTTTGS